MTKLKVVKTPELSFFEGYITAASEMFLRGQLDATLEVCAFDIGDHSITVDDVITAAHPDGFNPIDYVTQRSVEEMETEINTFLTVERNFWKPNSVPATIEQNLRSGFWSSFSECFDYKNSQIFEVGNDVPYINMGPGFTYVLINKEVSRCMLLVGNNSD